MLFAGEKPFTQLSPQSGGTGTIFANDSSYSDIDTGLASYTTGTNVTAGSSFTGSYLIYRGFAKFDVSAFSAATEAKIIVQSIAANGVDLAIIESAQSNDLAANAASDFTSVNKSTVYSNDFSYLANELKEVPLNATALAVINANSIFSLACLSVEDILSDVTTTANIFGFYNFKLLIR